MFKAVTHVASLFNPKAKKWVEGRKEVFSRMEKTIPRDGKIIWVHCASLGEFEQGRTVMEKFRSIYPAYRILLTFFSPSGYEAQKHYKGADWIFYLPMDGPRNAKRFLEIVQPALVVFVKYEFWYYYLKKIRYRNIPLLLISALFRKDMSFFRWYGGLSRKMLARFDHLFVQDTNSKKLVDKLGLSASCTVAGDTRFDRVVEIAEKSEPIEPVEKFIADSKAIVAGSTWPEDEKLLKSVITNLNDSSLKLIIAPHEINQKHLYELTELFPSSILYSQLPGNTSSPVLIIDNIGMLSRLYKYGYIAYVGGGMIPMGVHNVLEAAVYEKVVLMGPYYHKYREAVGLVNAGGGISFNNETELRQMLEDLLHNYDEYLKRCGTAGEFVRSQKGATQKIMDYIQEKRLLTN